MLQDIRSNTDKDRLLSNNNVGKLSYKITLSSSITYCEVPKFLAVTKVSTRLGLTIEVHSLASDMEWGYGYKKRIIGDSEGSPLVCRSKSILCKRNPSSIFGSCLAYEAGTFSTWLLEQLNIFGLEGRYIIKSSIEAYNIYQHQHASQATARISRASRSPSS